MGERPKRPTRKGPLNVLSGRFTLFRRLAVFVLALAVLAGAGLALLLFRWWGERGAPPAGRLYVAGDFESGGPLLVLTRSAAGNACYTVEAAGRLPPARVCRGDPERVWAEDALLDLSIGARGVPRVSIAGLRVHEGDLIGSLADRKRPHPRYPLRAYGVPAVAARVVPCASGGTEAVCLEVHDRGGRLAVVRGGGRVEKPRFGERLPLFSGDALWLGLVAFEVETGGGALVLRRVDRLRPGRRRERLSDFGGDRRWLGRLWHVEAPDPGPGVPERFEVHPLQIRYTTRNLSRQRTNLEGEDVLQRLIDGGWLCLGENEVVWRPLDEPGCEGDDGVAAVTRSAMADYQRARFGDLAHLSSSLVGAANAALAERSYLEDATALPFAFDWRLAYDGPGRRRSASPSPQPEPRRLWGVRFGVSRQIRRLADFNRGIPPTVVPRASTGRYVVQVLQGDGLVSSFYLPAGAARGTLCLGRHGDDVEADAYRPTSGSHLPLGSVAFADDPRRGTWTADTDAACVGCLLAFETVEEGETVSEGGGRRLAVRASGDCGLLRAGREDQLFWGPYRLRAGDRGRPWLAATDPGTGRRHFAEELYLSGGLRPLLGDEGALSGVEAAIREYLRDSGEIGVAPGLETLELTIDGDLQLAAAAVVDALAREHVTAANDPEPDRVSVTAAVLDAGSGDLLAAVSWSRRGSERARESDWAPPSSWELGSGQADVLENGALLRRGAVGSTFKITGSYALLTNGDEGLVEGAELTRTSRHAFIEAGGDGELYLDRGGLGRPSRRSCSTGPHYLPASGRGYTSATFVRRFAESCNNFFVLTGFRHAGGRPARLGRARGAAAGRDELLIEVRGGRAVLVEPRESEERLVERIREGLAADAAAELPRSLYGVFLRLGFQPRPDLFPVRGEAPAELAFAVDGRRVAAPLVNDWFSPAGRGSTPALEPGRDFAYPGVPSPGRLDKSTVKGPPALELYDGDERFVRRSVDDGRTDVQYSMLMIGQSSVEASALGLAALYAPAARADGRAVSPCLFRANCGAHRAGSRVIDGPRAGYLNEALRAVVRDGTARGGLARIGLAGLPARGWGGKTGTYQMERRLPVLLSRAQWKALKAWACGVGGVERPRIAGGGVLVRSLSGAPPGGALGARACEDPDLPFNPAGVHVYGDPALAEQLDDLAEELERTAESKVETFHSFVALAPPERGTGWPAAENPAEGIVVAVLVDRETEDEKSIAVQIGGELAAAVERWAAFGR